ncbi:twin-arginine translocation signal domain-containing protein [bacterium]|nr:twin-arginine translocation signal domain-containing protein [bacterium]
MSDRRTFLKQVAIAGSAMALTPLAEASVGVAKPDTAVGTPKRVIFMVSDGMSLGVPAMAEEFSRIVRGKGTHFADLLRDTSVAHGLMETYSLNSIVTDSAASSTCWGSGSRVFNGSINTLPDGRGMDPILRVVKKAGFGTGLVTTTTVTHATPAGFGAVQASRGSEAEIAPQYLDVVDVVLGGGNDYFDPARRKDKRDVYGEYAKAGYAVARTKTELAALPADGRMLGIFYNGHLPYTIDQRNVPALEETVPTLAEMTAKALEILEKNPNGFLLQVEGGRVDHAAHTNDAAALLWDQVAFDDAIGVVLEFLKKHPETMLIITSDHGNSNPGLNGMGDSYAASTSCFAQMQNAKASFDLIKERVARDKVTTPEGFLAITEELLGITISKSEAEIAFAALNGAKPPTLNGQHRSFSGAMGEILGNYTGIWFTGTTHTQDYTLIAAKGPIQDAFEGLIKNTKAFPTITAHFGISHRNPSMTLDEAKQFLSQVPEIRKDDWA